jgi:hypothetical protein
VSSKRRRLLFDSPPQQAAAQFIDDQAACDSSTDSADEDDFASSASSELAGLDNSFEGHNMDADSHTSQGIESYLSYANDYEQQVNAQQFTNCMNRANRTDAIRIALYLFSLYANPELTAFNKLHLTDADVDDITAWLRISTNEAIDAISYVHNAGATKMHQLRKLLTQAMFFATLQRASVLQTVVKIPAATPPVHRNAAQYKGTTVRILQSKCPQNELDSGMPATLEELSSLGASMCAVTPPRKSAYTKDQFDYSTTPTAVKCKQLHELSQCAQHYFKAYFDKLDKSLSQVIVVNAKTTNYVSLCVDARNYGVCLTECRRIAQLIVDNLIVMSPCDSITASQPDSQTVAINDVVTTAPKALTSAFGVHTKGIALMDHDKCVELLDAVPSVITFLETAPVASANYKYVLWLSDDVQFVRNAALIMGEVSKWMAINKAGKMRNGFWSVYNAQPKPLFICVYETLGRRNHYLTHCIDTEELLLAKNYSVSGHYMCPLLTSPAIFEQAYIELMLLHKSFNIGSTFGPKVHTTIMAKFDKKFNKDDARFLTLVQYCIDCKTLSDIQARLEAVHFNKVDVEPTIKSAVAEAIGNGSGLVMYIKQIHTYIGWQKGPQFLQSNIGRIHTAMAMALFETVCFKVKDFIPDDLCRVTLLTHEVQLCVLEYIRSTTAIDAILLNNNISPMEWFSTIVRVCLRNLQRADNRHVILSGTYRSGKTALMHGLTELFDGVSIDGHNKGSSDFLASSVTSKNGLVMFEDTNLISMRDIDRHKRGYLDGKTVVTRRIFEKPEPVTWRCTFQTTNVILHSPVMPSSDMVTVMQMHGLNVHDTVQQYKVDRVSVDSAGLFVKRYIGIPMHGDMAKLGSLYIDKTTTADYVKFFFSNSWPNCSALFNPKTARTGACHCTPTAHEASCRHLNRLMRYSQCRPNVVYDVQTATTAVVPHMIKRADHLVHLQLCDMSYLRQAMLFKSGVDNYEHIAEQYHELDNRIQRFIKYIWTPLVVDLHIMCGSTNIRAELSDIRNQCKDIDFICDVFIPEFEAHKPLGARERVYDVTEALYYYGNFSLDPRGSFMAALGKCVSPPVADDAAVGHSINLERRCARFCDLYTVQITNTCETNFAEAVCADSRVATIALQNCPTLGNMKTEAMGLGPASRAFLETGCAMDNVHYSALLADFAY